MYLESSFCLLGPRERVTGYMYPPIANALAALCMPSWPVSATRYPACAPRAGGAQVSGPAKFTARGTTSQNTWAPGLAGWTIWAPTRVLTHFGPHGGESRIEPGSTPGTHFSLLHSPGLLSVGAFLLLLPLPVPHNLAPSVTLSRTFSSLPRLDSHERSSPVPTALNSFVTIARSDPDASCSHIVPKRLVHGNSARQCRIARGRATRNRNHTAPSDCRLSLALHLYRLLYTAFDSSQRSHGFPGQENLLQDGPQQSLMIV